MAGLDEVVLGALLHDIGKFMQRAHRGESTLSDRTRNLTGQICPSDRTGRSTHRHALWTNEFFETVLPGLPRGLDVSTVANLASYHHRPSTGLEELVSCADRLSAGIDREPEDDAPSGRGSFRRVSLRSVFEALDIGRGKPESCYEYDLVPLEPKAAFPVKRERAPVDLTDSYAELWERFVAEVKRLPQASPGVFIPALSAALEKHTWCIPSATVDTRPDISLYDHMRTTAAIAAALYGYFGETFKQGTGIREEQAFVLVAGDVSGIQTYLYSIAHAGTGGTARCLRARSLFVSMVSQIAELRILQAFGMPSLNAILTAGGNFTLLLPAAPDWRERIDDFRREFDRWCLRHLNAELRVNIAASPCTGRGLLAFADTREDLNAELRRVKNRALSAVLAGPDGWQTDSFVLDVSFGNEESVCQSCHKFPGRRERPGEPVLCDRCLSDRVIGSRLTRARGVALLEGEGKGSADVLGWSFCPLEDVSRPPPGAVFTFSFEEIPSNVRIPTVGWGLANYVPRVEGDPCAECRNRTSCRDRDGLKTGQPLLFECLAARAQGRNALAYLKADVDDLGKILALGFKKSGVKASLSRVATMSRMLEYFFSEWLNHALRSDSRFDLLYTVYSGGDDLLVTGPWDQVVEFSRALYGEFRRFTSLNPSVTLSAAVEVVRPRTPISQAAPQADNDLERAKSRPGKNRLALFGDVVPWDKVPKVLEDGKALVKWASGPGAFLGSGHIWKLLNYGRMYREFQKTGFVEKLRFLPLLAYDIARNWPGIRRGEERAPRAQARLWAESLKDLRNPMLPHLAAIALYAMTACRGGRDA